uniref:Uncharacterized protein n=1 Tax=Arundo donax TaxID=35708 RepID=A0A0A8ZL00_ARUDO
MAQLLHHGFCTGPPVTSLPMSLLDALKSQSYQSCFKLPSHCLLPLHIGLARGVFDCTSGFPRAAWYILDEGK